MSVRSRLGDLEHKIETNRGMIKLLEQQLRGVYGHPTIALPVVDKDGKPVMGRNYGGAFQSRKQVALQDVVRLLADKLNVDLVYRNDEPGRVELKAKPRDKK